MKVLGMRRLRVALVTAVLVTAVGAWSAAAQADPPNPPANGKVYVCHATSDMGGGTQHYNLLEISINAAFGTNGGHFKEDGSSQDGHELDFVLVEPGGTLPPDVPTGVVHKEGLTCEGAVTTTAATLRSFTATKAPGSVLLRWRTVSEVDVLGYNVWAEKNGQRVKLNKRLIAGKGVSGGAYGFKYRTPKGKKAPARFWLETVNLDGTRSWRQVRAA